MAVEFSRDQSAAERLACAEIGRKPIRHCTVLAAGCGGRSPTAERLAAQGLSGGGCAGGEVAGWPVG